MLINSITELIGNTPLLRLNKLYPNREVYLKLECFNPFGSHKDRVSLAMLDQAVIAADQYVLEVSSGNTALSLSCLSALRGHKLVVFVPTGANEKIASMKAMGAEVHETPKEEGLTGAIKECEHYLNANPNVVRLNQFRAKANFDTHENTTAVEIWNDLNGKVSGLVCGVGSAGLLKGIARYFKKQNPWISVVAVEPQPNQPLLKESHIFQKIGAAITEEKEIDHRVAVTDEEAIESCKRLWRMEGILAGIATGANIAAIDRMEYFVNGPIVTIATDLGNAILKERLSD